MSVTARGVAVALALTLALVIVALGGAMNAVARRPGAAGFAMSEDYARFVEESLVGLGTWPGHGFRAAGSTAEHAAADFVARQMKAIGLTDVRKEAVPVDAWEFRGASLAVAAGDVSQRPLVASSMGGVPGPPERCVRGQTTAAQPTAWSAFCRARTTRARSWSSGTTTPGSAARATIRPRSRACWRGRSP